jgi:threonine aldolase
VTHLDVDAAGIAHALATIRRFFAAPPAARAAGQVAGSTVY